MYRECLYLNRVSSWLDTVDIEHVVLELVNKCNEDVKIVRLVVIGEPGSDKLYEKPDLHIPREKSFNFEVLIDKLYDYLHVVVEVRREKVEFTLKYR